MLMHSNSFKGIEFMNQIYFNEINDFIKNLILEFKKKKIDDEEITFVEFAKEFSKGILEMEDELNKEDWKKAKLFFLIVEEILIHYENKSKLN